jgi:hypothetical protein
MKKAVVFALFSAFALVAATGHCDTGAVATGSTGNGPESGRHAHRDEMIAQRKASGSNAEVTRKPSNGDSKAAKFWKNEGERSGVSGWKAPNLNPLPYFKEQDRKFKERKAAK